PADDGRADVAAAGVRAAVAVMKAASAKRREPAWFAALRCTKSLLRCARCPILIFMGLFENRQAPPAAVFPPCIGSLGCSRRPSPPRLQPFEVTDERTLVPARWRALVARPERRCGRLAPVARP